MSFLFLFVFSKTKLAAPHRTEQGKARVEAGVGREGQQQGPGENGDSLGREEQQRRLYTFGRKRRTIF